MPSLYHFQDCPFCYRVRLYLAERAIAYTSVRCERGALPPELPSLHTLGRLPVWLDDAGRPFFGSLAIIAYLAETTPGETLWPDTPIGRARVQMAEELVTTGLLQPLIRLADAQAWPPEAWDIPAQKREMALVRRTLAALESIQAGRPWLLGERLTVADLLLAQPLTILERFGLDLETLPGLNNLAERLAQRPSVLAARTA